MASKEQDSSYEIRLSLYEKLIATSPEITRKGNAYAYTSHNGHMFSLLSPSGELGLRLPKDEREHFLQMFEAALFESHGAVMREYVAVPDALLADTKALQKYLSVSLAYIKTLKPKATKMKQATPTAKKSRK